VEQFQFGDLKLIEKLDCLCSEWHVAVRYI
jgi:hypothetical protein